MKTKDLIEIVTRLTRLECENNALKAEVAELRQTVNAQGETRVEGDTERKKAVDASVVLDELLNGVPDEKLGRVRYTKDGRE